MPTGLPGLVVLIAAMGAQSGDETLTTAPEARKAPSVRAKCTCPDETEAGVLILEGLVVDAELKLAADGRSPRPRQATIFDVSGENGKGVSGRTPVYHMTDKAACGVVFDYGKKYTLAVREDDAGEFETDACLMRAVQARH